MKTEFIGIGSELLYGRVQDTNGYWLASWLHKKGINLKSISLCGDERDDVLDSLKRAMERSDLIILSGGLGPTEDDLTKNILADHFGKKISISDKAAEIVSDNYKRYGKEWRPEWNHYHHIPKDFEVFDNPKGLAPGLGFESNGKIILCAPGVPSEFRAMVDETFLPWLINQKNFRTKESEQIVIRTHGVPEEMIFNKLGKNLWEDLSKFGNLSSLPQVLGIDLVISLPHGVDKKDIQEKIQKIISKTELEPYIWQWGDLSLEELIIKTCIEKEITFSFSESCTGGFAGHRITNISGCSSCYLGSAVTYANEAKIAFLDVQEQTLKENGAVSTQTAKEMANGALKKFNSHIAISWTGIAGPNGGTKEKPVGSLALGWSSSNGHHDAEIVQYTGDRKWLKKRFSEKGLFKLLKIARTY